MEQIVISEMRENERIDEPKNDKVRAENDSK
jgi:hypothetical protein